MEKITEIAMIEDITSKVGVEEELRAAATARKLDEINREMAKKGTATEHQLGYWESMKIYRKAAFWSMFISLSIIMRAYDIEIMGNFFALPAFQQHLGTYYEGHGYQIPASWVRFQILNMQTSTDAFEASGHVYGLPGRPSHWSIPRIVPYGEIWPEEDVWSLSFSHRHPYLYAGLRLLDCRPHSLSISLWNCLG